LNRQGGFPAVCISFIFDLFHYAQQQS